MIFLNKIFVFLTIIMFAFNGNSQSLETQFSYGFPGGDAKDLISYNFSGDIAYMIPVKFNRKDDEDDPYDRVIGNKHIGIDIGVSAGYSYSVGKEGLDDFQFLPIAAVPRITYFKLFSLSFPIGYAIGLNPDVSSGGFYGGPNFAISGKKLSFNLSLRMINLDGLYWRTINIGLGYKF